MAFFLFAAVVALVLAFNRDREEKRVASHQGSFLLLSGLMAGSAAACKYPGVVFVIVPLFVTVVFVSVATKREGGGGAPLRLAAVFLVGVVENSEEGVAALNAARRRVGGRDRRGRRGEAAELRRYVTSSDFCNGSIRTRGREVRPRYEFRLLCLVKKACEAEPGLYCAVRQVFAEGLRGAWAADLCQIVDHFIKRTVLWKLLEIIPGYPG